MASRKSAAKLGSADVAALESAAVAAVKAIDNGYAAASKAIMAYVIGAKHASVTPPVFEAGIARIADAVPGVAKITVGAYISNARRIFAADKEALAKAVEAAGTDSIKALAAACPVVSKAKAEGQTKRAEAKADAKADAVPAVKVSTPSTDPMLVLNNGLVMLRKLATGKKKAKLILAAIGEIEDMMQDIKDMMAA